MTRNLPVRSNPTLPTPNPLANAHRTLDRAVFAAYNWPPDLTDQDLLARLLALNHKRAASQI